MMVAGPMSKWLRSPLILLFDAFGPLLQWTASKCGKSLGRWNHFGQIEEFGGDRPTDGSDPILSHGNSQLVSLPLFNGLYH